MSRWWKRHGEAVRHPTEPVNPTEPSYSRAQRPLQVLVPTVRQQKHKFLANRSSRVITFAVLTEVGNTQTSISREQTEDSACLHSEGEGEAGHPPLRHRATSRARGGGGGGAQHATCMGTWCICPMFLKSRKPSRKRWKHGVSTYILFYGYFRFD